MVVKPVSNDIGMAFRADAKAEGQEVAVAGWECLGGREVGEARWFSVRLSRKNTPAAFCPCEPYWTIAASKLHAALVCVTAFSDAWRGA